MHYEFILELNSRKIQSKGEESIENIVRKIDALIKGNQKECEKHGD